MSAINPPETILNLSTAYWASRCLHITAELGVADTLEDVPQTATELAKKTGADARTLHRVMRALANRGIFELDAGLFSHNAASRLLRTNAEGSMRSMALMAGLPFNWNAFGALGDSLKSGRPAVASIVKKDIFAYLGAHPEEARIFNEAMVGVSFTRIAHVLEAYDFGGAEVVSDIGGGLGHLLTAVLDANPRAQGVLYDLPEVIDQAKRSDNPRIEYVAGDFFRDRIPSCDIYMLMTVLHDWSDDESIEILQNIRAGARPGAKVLLIEGIVEEGSSGDFVIDLDIEMLALTTGRERMRHEWESVLNSAGLRLQNIRPAGPWYSVIESVVP